jgi:hypothetical protein
MEDVLEFELPATLYAIDDAEANLLAPSAFDWCRRAQRAVANAWRPWACRETTA